MVPYLLAKRWIWNGLYEVVDGIDGRMHTFKPLDLLPDGQRVVPIGLDLGERPIDAAHSRQGSFFRHECYSQTLSTPENMIFRSQQLVFGTTKWWATPTVVMNVSPTSLIFELNCHRVRYFERARAQAENKLHQHTQWAGKVPIVTQMMLQVLAERWESVFTFDIIGDYVETERKKQTSHGFAPACWAFLLTTKDATFDIPRSL